MQGKIVRDQSGASTELGYIFTFLLGVLLLSLFSIWAFGLETSTREKWNDTAIDVNMADIAAAVERADLASREDFPICDLRFEFCACRPQCLLRSLEKGISFF